MKAYLACFDITDDRTRRQVGLQLLEYGQRVQRSVFEISVTRPEELERIREGILPLLDPDDDVRFYALCEHCRKGSKNAEGERIASFPAAVVL